MCHTERLNRLKLYTKLVAPNIKALVAKTAGCLLTGSKTTMYLAHSWAGYGAACLLLILDQQCDPGVVVVRSGMLQIQLAWIHGFFSGEKDRSFVCSHKRFEGIMTVTQGMIFSRTSKPWRWNANTSRWVDLLQTWIKSSCAADNTTDLHKCVNRCSGTGRAKE